MTTPFYGQCTICQETAQEIKTTLYVGASQYHICHACWAITLKAFIDDLNNELFEAHLLLAIASAYVLNPKERPTGSNASLN